jgi:DNA-binding HxlR family transcriptional regulator
MRKKVDVVESERYYKILLLIHKGINYNRAIATELDIKPNTLIENLQELENKKIVTGKTQKEYNRKVYEINYEKIGELFLNDMGKHLLSVYKTYIKNYVAEKRVEQEKARIKDMILELKKMKIITVIVKATFFSILLNDDFKNEKLSILSCDSLRSMFLIMFLMLKNRDIVDKMVEGDNKGFKKELKDVNTKINELWAGYSTRELRNIETEFINKLLKKIDLK